MEEAEWQNALVEAGRDARKAAGRAVSAAGRCAHVGRALSRQRTYQSLSMSRCGAPRVISDCHFRKTATEYDRKTVIKWLSCTEK
jgi:hypothetical protein